MRVAIHVLQNRVSGTGMSTYIRGLLRLLDKFAPDISITVVANAVDETAWRSDIPADHALIAVRHSTLRPSSAGSLLRRTAYELGCQSEARAVQRVLQRCADVVHFTGDRITPLRLDTPAVLSCFCANYWTVPSQYVFGTRMRQRLAVESARRSLKLARAVVVPSVYCKDVLVQQASIQPDRVVVIPLPAWVSLLHESGYDFSKRSGGLCPAEQYFFYPAAHFAYKNHRRAIEAVAVLAQRWSIPHRLLFTGPTNESLMDYARRLGVGHLVEFTGFVDAGRLRELFLNATAVLHPSLYEAGGSFSMFEAMWYGVPVVSSALGSMLEFAFDASLTFDPYDPADIARVLRLLIIEPDYSREVAARGAAYVRSFRAEDAAAGMRLAYQMGCA